MTLRFLLFLISTLFFLAGSLHANTYLSDLEIEVPRIWSVKKNIEGLRFKLPKSPDSEFTPEVILRERKGAIYIDDTSGAKLYPVLQKMIEGTGAKNVYLQDPRVMVLKNNTKAMMYYANIEYANLKLVQTHLVFSSREKHYILSYTDLPESYETGNDRNYQRAWSMMNSIVIKSGNGPSRELQAYSFLKVVAFLICLFVGVSYLRKKMAGRSYRVDSNGDIVAQLPGDAILLEVQAVAVESSKSVSADQNQRFSNASRENIDQDDEAIKTVVAEENRRSVFSKLLQQFQNHQPQGRDSGSEQAEYVSEDPDAQSLSEISEASDEELEFKDKVLKVTEDDQWEVDSLTDSPPEQEPEISVEKADQESGQEPHQGVGQSKKVV